jgi:hypothetical protein
MITRLQSNRNLASSRNVAFIALPRFMNLVMWQNDQPTHSDVPPASSIMPITLEDIVAHDDVLDHLSSTCDFNPVTDPEPPFFSVDGASDLTVVASDGAGGQFVIEAPSCRLLFFSSEGAAGVLADDFAAGIALIVACPWWQDLLKYSAQGSLSEIRRAAPLLEAYWNDDDEVTASRAFLTETLGLEAPRDLPGELHRAVSTPIIIRSSDDAPADSLFGRFTIDDNPMLKFA